MPRPAGPGRPLGRSARLDLRRHRKSRSLPTDTRSTQSRAVPASSWCARPVAKAASRCPRPGQPEVPSGPQLRAPGLRSLGTCHAAPTTAAASAGLAKSIEGLRLA
eukprot:168141-Rhodomonas_salina.1